MTITFSDLKTRNAKFKSDLIDEWELDKDFHKTKPDEVAAKRDHYFNDGSPSELFDPVFRKVRRAAAEGADFNGSGRFPDDPAAEMKISDSDLKLAAAAGILLRDRYLTPDADGFSTALYAALGEFTDHAKLYRNSLRELGKDSGNEVSAQEWAATVRVLINDGVDPNDSRLKTFVDSAYSRVVGADTGQPSSAVEISLPDFEDNLEVEIVPDNLYAVQALYFSWSLDDLRMFQVVDKLVELFNQGLLPITRNKAGDLLYQYWKKSIERFTEVERRNLYARAFGAPGGEPTVGNPNREFGDLFLRFVSSASEWYRQDQLNQLFVRADYASPVSLEQVRKSGRDLAANMSLYGYGVAYFAATELQTQINDMDKILRDPEVKAAYGAKDMWQVIDQVALMELGGNRNSVRYRTIARSGAIIIRWLANNANKLGSSANGVLIDREITHSDNGHSSTPLVNPSDKDLIEACEQWLAVTGTPDDRIEQFSQASESPNTTSRPLPFSSIARDALTAAGVNPAIVNMN